MPKKLNARQKLKRLSSNETALMTIHYSCEGLSDDNEGLSPRITSIAVRDYSSEVGTGFSIHIEAEIAGTQKSEILDNYDSLEVNMLEKFYAFVGEHKNFLWLHWHMSSATYGFQHLSNRYEALTKELAPEIPDDRKYNLPSIIYELYGLHCVDKPYMQQFFRENQLIGPDFLLGAQEAEAFAQQEYVRIHKSTVSKVGAIASLYALLQARKLKVTRYRSWLQKVSNFLETPWGKILSLASMVGGIIGLLLGILAFVK